MAAGYLPVGEFKKDGSETLTADEIMAKITAGDRRPYPEWFTKSLRSLLNSILNTAAGPAARSSLADVKVPPSPF